MRRFLLYVFFFLLILSVRAQSICFISLGDATGIDITSQELSQLEAAACALIDSFPVEFRDSFKVFDAGFYLHHPRYDGGVPQVFEKLKAKAALQSKYYLLIGRDINYDGVSKIWYDISLPPTDRYECFTDSKIKGLKYELELNFNKNIDYTKWHSIKLNTIIKIDAFIKHNLNCCELNERNYSVQLIDTSKLSLTLCIDGVCCLDNEIEAMVGIITEVPSMPKILYKIDYENESCLSLKTELFIQYIRGNKHDTLTISQDNIELGFSYSIEFDRLIGGRVRFIIKDENENELKRDYFTIKGENPSTKKVFDYVKLKNYSEKYWFFNSVIVHESASHPQTLMHPIKQFNSYQSNKENLLADWNAYSRCPNRSFDNGWGIMQLTNPVPRSEALWHWKYNIDDGYTLLGVKAMEVKSRILNNYLFRVSQWNQENPLNPVKGHEKLQIGDVIWVHTINEYYKGNNDIENHFPSIDVEEGERSFLDAMIIKAFNGIGTVGAPHYDKDYYYLYYNPTDESIKPEWRVDSDAHYGNDVNYYVDDICTTNIPKN